MLTLTQSKGLFENYYSFGLSTEWSINSLLASSLVAPATGSPMNSLSQPAISNSVTSLDLTTANSTSIFPTTTDDVPDDISSTVELVPNGAHIVSTLDAPGDQDFFKVELEAGKTYEFTQYGAAGGPSGVPLSDAYLELYDSAGNLLAEADGGGRTPGGEAYGTDALLSFTAATSGTYYINARAFDNSTIDDSDKGEPVGDYDIGVATVEHATSYHYYSPDSPLYAIDWGTQVTRTSRNPDGEEGPRETDNAYTGTAWNPYGIEGKNVITYYFAKQGEVFIDEDPTTLSLTDTIVANGFSQWEKDAYLVALGEYEKVADVVYVEVQNRTDADFVFVTYYGTPGPGISLLGQMEPPGENNAGRSEFNAADERWTPEGLAKGGFSFTTLIHEMGHGHGLAHPHDNGGSSGVMHGVDSAGITIQGNNVPDPTGVWPSYTTGDYDLNQAVYTMMSYEDGWEKSPYGQADSQDPYGWLGSLMAFDIAAIQDKYGVNEDAATGNDTYVLPDENVPGTYYSCIWDAGGTDEIVYDGAKDAVIDLRPASLQYEEGGGGWISYAWGVYGGFTIANGVTIENARSGSGNDTLTGNEAANRLDAGAGNDNVSGGAGDDILIGGLGQDVLSGGDGSDLFVFETIGDSVVGSGRDTILDFEQGSDLIDLSALGASSFIGSAAFTGEAGEVRAVAFDGATIIELDQDGDRHADMQIAFDHGVELNPDDFVFAEMASSSMAGGGGAPDPLGADQVAMF